jgi:hypothetical protein
MRRVLIATPCYTGEVSIMFSMSLLKTFIMGPHKNIDVQMVYTKHDALVQKSRNYFVALALEQNFDDIVFIDDDILWDPEWFFRLLDYPKDVVSGIYRKKINEEVYPILPVVHADGSWYPPPIDTQTGLIKVSGVPTGFLRLSRKAMQALWDCSEPYTNGQLPNEHLIFDIKIIDGVLYSEDFIMSKKLTSLGIDMWLDPRLTCGHEGKHMYTGDFMAWLDKHKNGDIYNGP